jgi:opacity protein-like surface antigen
MLRKLTLALIAAVALSAALAPTTASARGSGWSGSGSSRSFHDHSPRLGTRFIGPAVQKDFRRHHWHGFGIGYIGPAYVGATYLGPGYLDQGCYVVRRVRTPYGYRLRTINVCVYY